VARTQPIDERAEIGGGVAQRDLLGRRWRRFAPTPVAFMLG